MRLLEIADRLSEELSELEFARPVTHVYNPLEYAREAHGDYLEKYGQGTREIVLFGMNPGPWGMAQTGVPFGEIGYVRDWLGIEGQIERPEDEHPKRPIEGWECRRSEVSGRRLWGWFARRFGTPQKMFERVFVANYCPLVFMEESGRNRTPDRLKAAERRALFPLCDGALREVVEELEPAWVIGVGNFARARAEVALEGLDLQLGKVPHPSPASPQANKGWDPLMDQAMAALGIDLGPEGG